ncbi:MAG: NAD(P)/FAD-dependent oxidoreductase, partial [Planctomycetia bacterium]
MAGRSADVVVVGGGVVGLATAYELARRGMRVTLLDQGAFGRESSWAGAGMISPAPSVEFSASTAATAFDRLRTASYERFAGLAEELKEQTAVDVEYQRCGGVELADTEAALGRLAETAPVLAEHGIVHERLAAGDVSRFDAELGDGFLGGLSLPGVCQVRNPRLLVALEEACGRHGVELRPGAKVVGFEEQSGVLTGVKLADGSTVVGGEFVAAAGAWTGRLLESLGVVVAVRPLQGQIVLLRSTPGRFRRVVEVG